MIVGAGDIASCASSGDEATATLLDGIAGTVITLGDNVYDNGTSTEYTNCYDPSWGRHKARTRPSPGNHEYNTTNATGYYGYFGSTAGDPAKGYYSYDLGNWHIVVLNSNLSCAVISCAAGSAAGAVAAQRSRLKQQAVHARLLASSALQLRRGSWQRSRTSRPSGTRCTTSMPT